MDSSPRTIWTRSAEKFLEEERGLCLESRIGTVEHLVTDAMLNEYRHCDAETASEFGALLDDPETRHFVKMVAFTARHVPAELVPHFLLAAARTENPSFNKHFIWPCVICHGRRPVMVELLRIFRVGVAKERAGAAHGLYWGSMSRGTVYWPHDQRPRFSGDADETIEDLQAEFERLALTEFLRSTDVNVRRVLIAQMPKRTAENAELFDSVVAEARSSSDDYIRQRLAYQLGESALIPCLPGRRHQQ